MNQPEQHDDVLRDVLHHTVDHIHASADLAQRVESAARRRRTARRSATGAMALAAVAITGVLAAGHIAVHQAASPPYSTTVQLPACVAKQGSYVHIPAPGNTALTHVATGPVVPGSPVAAVVCRYEGGDLAASATVTNHTQLGRLQAAMNASRAVTGIWNCWLAADRDAVIVFAYPQGAGDLTVTYEGGGCATLTTNAGSYFAGGDVYTLITAWTGTWRSAVSPSNS